MVSQLQELSQCLANTRARIEQEYLSHTQECKVLIEIFGKVLKTQIFTQLDAQALPGRVQCTRL